MVQPEIFGLEIGPWSEWASAFASLASVVFVGVITWKIASNGLRAQQDLVVEAWERQRKETSTSLLKAFIAEIEGILRVVESQGWSEQLVAARDNAMVRGGRLDLRPGRPPIMKVYDSAAGQLGLIPGGASFALVNFYMLAHATFVHLDNPPPHTAPAEFQQSWADSGISKLVEMRIHADIVLTSLRRFIEEGMSDNVIGRS